MANLCNNRLVVSGPEKDIDDFFYRACGQVNDEFQTLLFENFVPLGKYERQKAISLWGTKWEPEVHHTARYESLTYEFDTAWSPPSKWFDSIVDQYPTLDFHLEWFEPGMGGAGTLEGVNGVSTEETHEPSFDDYESFGIVHPDDFDDEDDEDDED